MLDASSKALDTLPGIGKSVIDQLASNTRSPLVGQHQDQDHNKPNFAQTDRVQISAEGREAVKHHEANCPHCQAMALKKQTNKPHDHNKASESAGTEEPQTKADITKNTNELPGQLSEKEKAQLRELQKRDLEVKSHEMAHLSAAAGIARGGASFSYQTGPDGNRYAVGGEVSIDASKGNTPTETIQKAIKIRAAALAPANPSSQDRSVAAKAAQMEADARAELAREQAERGEEQGLNFNGISVKGASQAYEKAGGQSQPSRQAPVNQSPSLGLGLL